MARPDDVPPAVLTAFARNLLTLDAIAHHYGRKVPREQPSPSERFYSADGAYVGLSGIVEVFSRSSGTSNFETEVHRLIRNFARLDRRHHRRRHESGPKPPVPTVALAYFIEQHSDSSDAEPCFPWWWSASAWKPLPGDEVPDLPPFLGKHPRSS